MQKVIRKIIEIDESLCDGCGNCIVDCPEQAIQLVETSEGTKARLVKELFCDGLGACIGSCPTDALQIVEREVEPYNEEATIARIKEVAPEMLEEHLQHMKEHAHELEGHPSPPPMPHFSGCPSSRTMQWKAEEQPQISQTERSHVPSELRQWPIQLHLVAPFAPYFKDADLAIIADCVPFTYANFHQDFVKGKAIAIGCPKLDDVTNYVDKIADIIKIGGPKSVEVVVMEVPCCSGLVSIVKEAMKKSGRELPVKRTVLSIKGQVM